MNTAKEEKRTAHRVRMAKRRAKQLARTYSVGGLSAPNRSGMRTPRIFTSPPPIRANLSRNHPDYGMSPCEHARAKARRAAK